MPHMLVRHIATAVALSVLWLVIWLLVWVLHRQWWRISAVRRAMWVTPTVILAVIGCWTVTSLGGSYTIDHVATTLVAASVILTVALVLALPFSGVTLVLERAIRWAIRRVHPVSRDRSADTIERSTNGAELDSGADRSRRGFVVTGATAFPMVMLGTGALGMAESYSRVRIPEIPLHFEGLHPDLEGLRILHISDIHLGYITLDDLENTLLDAERQHYDMVLVTGDFADDVRLLADALRMLGELRPRHGIFGSLGNHDYYAGIRTVRRIIDRGPIPLLLDSGTTVRVGRAEIYLAGADDPATTLKPPIAGAESLSRERRKRLFLARSLDAALDGAPSNAFHLVMSHRPEGLDPASERGVALTIAGHTHGGLQMGLGGRSLFEPLMPMNYLWGHYRRRDSQLYTCSGAGHWFPFRFNCPREAPIYVLRSRS